MVMMESEAEAAMPVSATGAAPCKTLDIKGRWKRNPYGMVAGAFGIGFVLGGGLFTRLSAKVFGTGLRLALIVALPSLEKEITQVFAGSKLNEEKQKNEENGQ
jgi:hypothetical protein